MSDDTANEMTGTQLGGKARGGARPGAGRKAERGETTVMRIPAAYKSAIQALIEHLDATAEINRHYAPVESAPMFMRSLKGKAQMLTFRTSPAGDVTK